MPLLSAEEFCHLTMSVVREAFLCFGSARQDGFSCERKNLRSGRSLDLKAKILGEQEMLPTTTAIRKSGFGTFLKEKYIFEMQLFAGNSVVKFPTCV